MIILMMAVILTCFGVVMVYSASSVMAAKKFHDGFFFLKRQGLFALLGFGVMAFTMQIDYHTGAVSRTLFLAVWFYWFWCFCRGLAVLPRGLHAGSGCPALISSHRSWPKWRSLSTWPIRWIRDRRS